MSHYTKGRPAGYYNDLLTGNDHDFHKLLRKYSMSPDDNAGKTGTSIGSLANNEAGALSNLLKTSNRSVDVDLRHMAAGDDIGHVKLALSARGGSLTKPADTITLSAQPHAAAGYVPVYYLPWDTVGASIRLTIPAVGHGLNKGPSHPIDPADPYIFFTAAINGCSIYFRGTRQNPTIFHCGGSTGHQDINNQANFWRDVMVEFVSKDNTAGINLGPNAAHHVDKRDYISNPNVTSGYLSPTGMKSQVNTTARAKSYKAELKKKHAIGKLTVRSVEPWACVMGRRDDHGDWTFYLQENATIMYHEYSLANRFTNGGPTIRAVARPLVYREIFPNGVAHATVKAGLPSIL